MINSDLIQTLVMDRLNLRMNNREKIIGGDLVWQPAACRRQQKPRFLNVFEIFSPKSGLWRKVTYANSFNFYLKTFFEKIRFFFTPPVGQKSESSPIKLSPSFY